MHKEKGLLAEIAKARTALSAVYSKAPHLWPDDNNPLVECINSLSIVATKIKPETPEDCLAIFSITQTEYNGPVRSDAPLDEMQRRALEAGKLML